MFHTPPHKQGNKPDQTLKDYIERKYTTPKITFGMNQNGNGWYLEFDTTAPDTMREAVDQAISTLQRYRYNNF